MIHCDSSVEKVTLYGLNPWSSVSDKQCMDFSFQIGYPISLALSWRVDQLSVKLKTHPPSGDKH
jgi:hypothetical protein